MLNTERDLVHPEFELRTHTHAHATRGTSVEPSTIGTVYIGL